MSSLLTLTSNKGARKKRKTIGRGNGSGHGTSATRGGKGQTARTGSSKRPGFEGGQTPLYRKMPKYKGFNNPNHVEYQVVNVKKLNIFEDNAEVTAASLFEKKLVHSATQPVKILGDGDVNKKLTVKSIKFLPQPKVKLKKLKEK